MLLSNPKMFIQTIRINFPMLPQVKKWEKVKLLMRSKII